MKMIRLALLALALALSGCVTDGGLLKGSGVKTQPPAGWVAHCASVPRPVECGKP